jgi:hypothetical protein
LAVFPAQGGGSGNVAQNSSFKERRNLMKTIRHRDTNRLRIDTERIKQGLEKLKQDGAVWAIKQNEKDLADLMENLRGIEMDVSLMLTDCVYAGCQCGEKAPKVVFHDFREIFCCLDALFDGLKKARRQLAKHYIHPGIPVHLEIDYERFIKLVGQVQRRLNGQQAKTPIGFDGVKVHLVQAHRATV